ncbi:MAG: hypothetical protein JWN31_184 [Frankiales bacterium]|nr:hypothetical protein [Frankiales bacterium]
MDHQGRGRRNPLTLAPVPLPQRDRAAAVTWALSSLIALFTSPIPSNVPRGGLDPSWGFAMHAWVNGSAGDVPVTSFTYGPLGFLTVPVLWSWWTYVPALLFVLGVQVVLCRLLIARLTTWLPMWAGLLATLALAALVDVYVAETFLVTMALLAAHLMQQGVVRSRRCLAGGVVLAGLALLVKFSTGTVCLLLLAVVTYALSRRLLVMIGSVVAALGVSWVAFSLLTLRPFGFLHWLAGSRQVAQGYPAMAAEGFPHPEWHYAAGLTIALVLIAVAVVLAIRARALVPAACAGVVVLVAYLAFRQGFTRHDNEHEGSFISVATFLPLALLLGRRSRWLLAPLVLAPLVFGVVSGQRWHPVDRFRTIAHDVRGVVQPGRVTDDARATLQQALPLPEPVLDALKGHRVQVDPYNTAVLWAYGLHWGPSEVWALYSSYTPWLDDHNAASISRSAGPDRILRYAGTPAVDGRSSDLESPRYQLTEQCRWSTEVVSGLWQVLKPVANRCGAATSLGSVRFTARQQLVVPAPRHPGSIVTVRLQLDLPTSTKLWTLAFKPRTERHINLGGHWYRLVVANAGQPLVLRLPEGVPGGARSFAPLSTATLAVDLPGEAFFEEVPLS